MKIIRVAKDQQAEKANEFATILLEELDLEKSREESKKMAAARRKERKKNKKLQKIFEKRKLQENENNAEDADDGKNDEEDIDEEEYQPMCSKDKKDVKGECEDLMYGWEYRVLDKLGMWLLHYDGEGL